MWTHRLIKAEEVGETIELTYIQTSNITYFNNYYDTSNYNLPFPTRNVFKIIYSCKDGKWNKSEPIYGKIIPPTEESYVFE